MRQRTVLVAVCLTFAICAAFAHSIPEGSWQKATLKDIQRDQQTSLYRHFIVETPEMIYEVTPVKTMTIVRIDRGKLNFVVNSTIQYVIEKTNMYLRDSNGQVGEFHIEKKTFKQ